MVKEGGGGASGWREWGCSLDRRSASAVRNACCLEYIVPSLRKLLPMIPDQRPLGNNAMRRPSPGLGPTSGEKALPTAKGAAAITAERDFSETKSSLRPVVGRSREDTRSPYSARSR